MNQYRLTAEIFLLQLAVSLIDTGANERISFFCVFVARKIISAREDLFDRGIINILGEIFCHGFPKFFSLLRYTINSLPSLFLQLVNGLA